MCFIRSEQAENSDYFNVFKGSFEMRFIDQFDKPPKSYFQKCAFLKWLQQNV